ncbi:hypothetical protein Tco_0373031, partial [Tanacetum coccineum]
VPRQTEACHQSEVHLTERLMGRWHNTFSSWIHGMYCDPCSALAEAQACMQRIQPFPTP